MGQSADPRGAALDQRGDRVRLEPVAQRPTRKRLEETFHAGCQRLRVTHGDRGGLCAPSTGIHR